MQKIKTFLKEFPNHIQGYALVYPPSESLVFEKLCEILPKNSRYIKHFLETEWEEDPSLPNYVPQADPTLSLKRGPLKYYIVVYYEDKDDIGEHNAPVHFSL